MSDLTLEFTQRANAIKNVVISNDGKLPSSEAQASKNRKDMLEDMRTSVQHLDSVRTGATGKRPIDVSFADFVHKTWGFAPDAGSGAPESFFKALNLDYGDATINYLLTQGDQNDGYRWLVPELIREAMRLGLRKPALWPNIVAAEENISQPKINMPFINMSDAMPSKVGEAETIPTGSLSFGDRAINLQKIAVGLKITDEVKRYTALNLLAIYLQDMGVKMNLAMDVMAIEVLINGDGNGNAAPVIGVADTSKGIQYIDLLRAWIRLGLLGRMPQSMLSNENVALQVLMLEQFTSTQMLMGGVQPKILKPRTPLPSVQAYDVHGAMPVSNQLMLIDNMSALIKFNSDSLRLENMRIAEKQIDGTYASMTTGFANLFRDGRTIIDSSLLYSSYPYPSWMDAGAVQASNSFRNF